MMKHKWNSDSVSWLDGPDAVPAPMCSLRLPCKCGEVALYKEAVGRFYVDSATLKKGTIRVGSAEEAIRRWHQIEAGSSSQ